MADEGYECLKLENQLCFPLYVCAKEVVRRYRPLLDDLGLTYTQYIAMMALWEHRTLSVKEMGRLLYLDSGTLTPLLKKMEEMGLVTRSRDATDERVLVVSLTDEGVAMRDRALDVPRSLAACISVTPEDAMALKRILDGLMATFREDERLF
ncbi:MAG: MarR family transcriptional regulator [Candidatus Methanomethylophilaceae archaeon]|nr:MarR family transcriptional regulator [Candidatus Methanomethylophilaceae archaeon]